MHLDYFRKYCAPWLIKTFSTATAWTITMLSDNFHQNAERVDNFLKLGFWAACYCGIIDFLDISSFLAKNANFKNFTVLLALNANKQAWMFISLRNSLRLSNLWLPDSDWTRVFKWQYHTCTCSSWVIPIHLSSLITEHLRAFNLTIVAVFYLKLAQEFPADLFLVIRNVVMILKSTWNFYLNT